MALPQGAYQALADALGAENICDDPAVTSGYSYMWLIYSTHAQSGRYRPAAVVLPRSTQDVQTIIKIANRFKFNYIPVGTNLLPPTIPAPRMLPRKSTSCSTWTRPNTQRSTCFWSPARFRIGREGRHARSSASGSAASSGISRTWTTGSISPSGSATISSVQRVRKTPREPRGAIRADNQRRCSSPPRPRI